MNPGHCELGNGDQHREIWCWSDELSQENVSRVVSLLHQENGCL